MWNCFLEKFGLSSKLIMFNNTRESVHDIDSVKEAHRVSNVRSIVSINRHRPTTDVICLSNCMDQMMSDR